MKYLMILLILCMFSVMNIAAQEMKIETDTIPITGKKKVKDGKLVRKKYVMPLDTEKQRAFFLEKNISPENIENVSMDVETVGDEMVKVIRFRLKDGREEVIKFYEEKDKKDEIELKIEREIELTEDLATPQVKMGLVFRRGLKISEVYKDSPADKAGLEIGDIIKKLDEQIIYTYRGLLDHLGSYKPGDSAQFIVDRSGKEHRVILIFERND